ncbi:hypothetical protein SGLAM104S_08298 [Streptomyces glaucescens]
MSRPSVAWTPEPISWNQVSPSCHTNGSRKSPKRTLRPAPTSRSAVWLVTRVGCIFHSTRSLSPGSTGRARPVAWLGRWESLPAVNSRTGTPFSS